MIVVLDTGALIAVDKGDRDVLSSIQTALANGDEVQVPAGVVGQAWRKPSRQAVLSRTLKQCDEIPLDGPTARSCGELCQQTETADVIDASVAVAVADAGRYRVGVTLLTSDRSDMRVLLAASPAAVDPGHRRVPGVHAIMAFSSKVTGLEDDLRRGPQPTTGRSARARGPKSSTHNRTDQSTDPDCAICQRCARAIVPAGGSLPTKQRAAVQGS